ncbi:hypothetical protein PZH37_00410 [[Eubacterium] siraeum]|nr:hypothetical protein [[Eubacterium] siraeum]
MADFLMDKYCITGTLPKCLPPCLSPLSAADYRFENQRTQSIHPASAVYSSSFVF